MQVPWFWWEQGHCRFCLNQCVSLGKHWLLKKTQEGTLNTGVGKCNRSNSSLLFVGLTNSLVQCTHMTHGFPCQLPTFPFLLLDYLWITRRRNCTRCLSEQDRYRKTSSGMVNFVSRCRIFFRFVELRPSDFILQPDLHGCVCRSSKLPFIPPLPSQ